MTLVLWCSLICRRVPSPSEINHVLKQDCVATEVIHLLFAIVTEHAAVLVENIPGKSDHIMFFSQMISSRRILHSSLN
jgi:hypothetical protein